MYFNICMYVCTGHIYLSSMGMDMGMVMVWYYAVPVLCCAIQFFVPFTY